MGVTLYTMQAQISKWESQSDLNNRLKSGW